MTVSPSRFAREAARYSSVSILSSSDSAALRPRLRLASPLFNAVVLISFVSLSVPADSTRPSVGESSSSRSSTALLPPSALPLDATLNGLASAPNVALRGEGANSEWTRRWRAWSFVVSEGFEAEDGSRRGGLK